jgi:hypothetical protein
MFIMRLTGTFVNFDYTVQLTQKFRQVIIPIIVNFARATLEPAHNKGCGPLP